MLFQPTCLNKDVGIRTSQRDRVECDLGLQALDVVRGVRNIGFETLYSDHRGIIRRLRENDRGHKMHGVFTTMRVPASLPGRCLQKLMSILRHRPIFLFLTYEYTNTFLVARARDQTRLC